MLIARSDGNQNIKTSGPTMDRTKKNISHPYNFTVEQSCLVLRLPPVRICSTEITSTICDTYVHASVYRTTT